MAVIKTIGLPNSGRQAYYNTLYKIFFEELGFKTINSGETTKKIVDQGTKYSETDFCFAVKIYVGHVLELKDKADYIFVPSFTGKKQFFCPYHSAMPNIIQTIFPNIKILTENFNEPAKEDWIGLKEIAKNLKKEEKEILIALEKAKTAWEEEQKEQIKKEESKLKQKKIKVALIGPDSYVIHDKYCLMNIPELLEENNVLPVFFNPFKYKKNENPTQGRIQWQIEQEIINEIFDVINSKAINGLIFIYPFSCGPLFLIQEQILSKYPKKKILVLNVDESQNETRIKTRIEAFLDFVK